MFHGHLDYFQKSLLGGRLNIKLGDQDIPNAHNRWFILLLHVWGLAWIGIEIAFAWGRSHIGLHTTLEDLWPHYMLLEVSWHNIWSLSFRLSLFHGHNSWLVCEVVIRATSHMSQEPWPCNGEDPWLSSKAIICSHGPSSIVWSENGPCCGTIAYFVGGKKRGGFDLI